MLEALFNELKHSSAVIEISRSHEICSTCNANLFLSDEGFFACSNTECGIAQTQMIDFSAEWRYYGADDNQQSDPSRCGMPINPLLQESSFGCRLVSLSGGFSLRCPK